MAADFEVAKTVYRVGRELRVSDKAMLAGFEAGLVESGMRNLDYGDRDSLGVFQQRAGWGTRDQRLDPNYAAHKFFEKAKDMDAKHPGVSAGHLAQLVQVSAYPDRYDQREGEARDLLAKAAAAVDGGGAPTPPAPGQFRTWGTGVRVRKEASLSSPVVRTLDGPTDIRVQCQKKGDPVDSEGYSNDAWSYVPDLGGYISNIYIDDPAAWLPGVGTC
jgi:hypothetical protein